MQHFKEIYLRLLCILIQCITIFSLILNYNKEFLYLYYKYTLKHIIIIKNLIILNAEDGFFITLKISGLITIICAIPLVLLHFYFFKLPGLGNIERQSFLKNTSYKTGFWLFSCYICYTQIIPLIYLYNLWLNKMLTTNLLPLELLINLNTIITKTFYAIPTLGFVFGIYTIGNKFNIKKKLSKEIKKIIHFIMLTATTLITPIEPLTTFLLIILVAITLEFIQLKIHLTQNYKKMERVGFEPTTFKKQ